MKVIFIVTLVVSNGLWLAAYFNAKKNAGMPFKSQPAQATAGAGKRPQQKATPSLPSSWSELESEEYAEFIHNLRAFGCPDSTINHIVEGELREMQDERKPLQNLLASQVRKTDPRRIQAEEKLREMDRINSQILAQLLTGPTQSKDTVSDPGNNGQAKSKSKARQASPVKMPLVMSGVTLQINNPQSASNVGGATQNPALASPGVLVTTPEQAATIQKLQHNFINAVGGTNQDPMDPNYLKNWQAAQPSIDQMYYTLYGQEAYYQYQKAAATKAYAESQSVK